MNGIAITGMGIVSALGIDVVEFHERLLADEVAIHPAPWARPERSELVWWCSVKDFDPLDWMDPKVAEGTDIFAQYALAATAQARRQAGLREMDPLRTGIVHGTSIGGACSVMKAQHELDTRGVEAIPRKTMIQVWPNMASAQIAMRYDLHGPSFTVTTACASSLDAVGQAGWLIERGRADVVFAGGTHGGYSLPGGRADGDFVPALYYGGGQFGMESPTPADEPRKATLPFDVKRSGIVVGEGSAMFVLEREDHARARGAHIFGYLRGYGSLADGYHPSAPEPTGVWEARAMRLALDDAGMAGDEVQALIAHATGTPKGDTAEINAINEIHGGRGLPVSSHKGHIGHSGAAAGGMGIITGLLGMADGRFAHIANTDEPDPAADFEIVVSKPKPMGYDVFQVNAFGFGGQNASLILTRN